MGVASQCQETEGYENNVPECHDGLGICRDSDEIIRKSRDCPIFIDDPCFNK